MSRRFKQEREAFPRFIDVLSAAIITLWLIATTSLFIAIPFVKNLTIINAIAGSFAFFIGGGTIVFIWGGLISFPMWILLKRFKVLNKGTATLVGILTGLIISTSLFLTLPLDYSGTTRTLSEIHIPTIAVIMLLGAIAGWNGYRIANNGLRLKKIDNDDP